VGTVVLDQGEFQRLPGVMEMYRAALALVGGDALAADEDHLTRAGYIADVLGCAITLADLRITQGRLNEALRTYQEALRLAADQGGTVLRGTADMYVGMSQIACERNDLAAAAHYLRQAQELGEHTWLPQNPYRWRVAMARVQEAEGIWAVPSTCWRRRSRCTRATSPRTCGRSRRCGHASWPPRGG
jgi:LuxR family maltose regulon positive regulatory protein